MDQQATQQPLTGEARLAAYLDAITGGLGHTSRAASAQTYCTGLLLPGERKSIEPMAARLDPAHVQAKHQSLHHVVAEAEWDDAALLAAVRAEVLPAIERHGPVCYWIVDDSSFPKQGTHSVGVARQYCGQLGKPDNCQVAVSLLVANDHASLPIAYHLFLPEVWADDPARRAKAGVPDTITFETKTAIALGQLRQALAAGVPVGILLGDAGYGDETAFRVGVADLGLRYVLGVRSGTTVWAPGTGPLPPAPWSGRGRRPTRLRRDAANQPVTLKALALSLPAQDWRTVTWRAGTRGELSLRFAAVRVRPAHRALAGGVAADRVAGGGRRTRQVLVLQPAQAQLAQAPGQARQGALVDRARLPGPQAGAWPWPLRGPQLARFPPSCQPLHRSLRLSHRRPLPFPPSAAIHPQADRNTCATRRLPAARGCQCGLSGTCRIRLPRSASSLLSGWSKRCPAVRAACGNSGKQ